MIQDDLAGRIRRKIAEAKATSSFQLLRKEVQAKQEQANRDLAIELGTHERRLVEEKIKTIADYSSEPESDMSEIRVISSDMTQFYPEEAKRLREIAEKAANPSGQMICPHCQTKGSVTVNTVTLKKGVSGAKATGALLTGGLSLFAFGLSRKEKQTQAHCSNCSATWHF